MTAGHNRGAPKMSRNSKRSKRNTATDTGNEHRHTCLQPRARHQHAPRREVCQPKRRCVYRIDVADFQDVGRRSNKVLRMRTGAMLADHEDVLAGRSVPRARRLRAHDCRIENHSLANPCRINASTHGVNDANAIRSTDGRPLHLDTGQAAANPEVQVIERGSLGADTHLAGSGSALRSTACKADIWGDGGSLTEDFNSAHGARV